MAHIVRTIRRWLFGQQHHMFVPYLTATRWEKTSQTGFRAHHNATWILWNRSSNGIHLFTELFHLLFELPLIERRLYSLSICHHEEALHIAFANICPGREVAVSQSDAIKKLRLSLNENEEFRNFHFSLNLTFDNSP